MAQRNLRAGRRRRRAPPRPGRRARRRPRGGGRLARRRAGACCIPYDEQLGVHPQAEGFTEHQLWDFAHTTPRQYPLLLHFPYFDLYRKQVVKQADLVLALHLRGDAFSAEEKARDFAYYEALTVRDSSLSACTQAVIAAEVGHLELAYDYFARSGPDRPRQPRAQHPRRAAHRLAGGRLDRRRRRLRRHARPRRRPVLRAPAAPSADPPRLRHLLSRPAAARRGHPRPGALLAARRARRSQITHHGETITVTTRRTRDPSHRRDRRRQGAKATDGTAPDTATSTRVATRESGVRLRKPS